jgi:D-citramalate synthase
MPWCNKLKTKPVIEILDTTLRDGEQTSGVSFSVHEKKAITRLLLNELNVNRIEVASARVSEGEFDSIRQIAQWAAQTGYLTRLEVLGFVDNGASIRWIQSVGCCAMNLLCKGSLRHLTEQLRKTPEQHINDIAEQLRLAEQEGIAVNVYLEDWSNGIRRSPEYVYQLTDALVRLPVKRIMLPDTLGILHPESAYACCKTMVDRYPDVHFDFHAHNDYDLAVANVYEAVRAGIRGIHVTVNGLGERAGNASLSSVVAVIHDQLKLPTSINESNINYVSKTVETYSGIHIAPNSPVTGEFVFTQCAGVHADGDNKNNLYCNDLAPERFGRVREYALGKNSGKANIRKNLEALGIEIDEDSMRKVTERIIELGDKKEILTQEDLPYIVSDVLQHDTVENKIRILNYSLSLTQGLRPVATLKIEIQGKVYEETATGDGQYDAFVHALRKIYKSLERPFPMLTNYAVSIPPGGRTDAFVQTIISWQHEGVDFKTRGLDADQMEAAIKATVKMLNKIER